MVSEGQAAPNWPIWGALAALKWVLWGVIMSSRGSPVCCNIPKDNQQTHTLSISLSLTGTLSSSSSPSSSSSSRVSVSAAQPVYANTADPVYANAEKIQKGGAPSTSFQSHFFPSTTQKGEEEVSLEDKVDGHQGWERKIEQSVVLYSSDSDTSEEEEIVTATRTRTEDEERSRNSGEAEVNFQSKIVGHFFIFILH